MQLLGTLWSVGMCQKQKKNSGGPTTSCLQIQDGSSNNFGSSQMKEIMSSQVMCLEFVVLFVPPLKVESQIV